MNAQDHLDNFNAVTDPRNTERADDEPFLYLEDGTEVALPTHSVSCPICEGTGTYVNPSIDCGGLTAEDFDDEPGFADAYRDGAFDIPCEHCGGSGVVNEVDESALDDETLGEYQIQLEEDRAERDQMLDELKMGA